MTTGTKNATLKYFLQCAALLMASARSSAGAQQTPEQASEGDVGRDEVVLQLMLLEAGTERLIDFATITSRTGFLAFYKSRPEDLLREPMEDYTRQLLGSR